MNQTSLILEKHFGYYRKLEPVHKREFQRRVENFITQKEFVPRAEIPAVTEEMKIISSSIAIQLTFGLRETYFDHFKVLLFYPDEFLSNYSLSYQKGEVHPDGYLVFSWKHLALGNLMPDKFENIGLQLFARALGIQNNSKGPDYDILEPFHLHNWKTTADHEFEKLSAQGKIFYGRKIEREDFFPLAVEYFFENSDSLKKKKSDHLQCAIKLAKSTSLTYNGSYSCRIRCYPCCRIGNMAGCLPVLWNLHCPCHFPIETLPGCKRRTKGHIETKISLLPGAIRKI